MRPGLKAHRATLPDQKGQPTRTPTARGGVHDFVGIPMWFIPQPWPIVINLTEEHHPLRQLLGDRYT